MDVQKEFYSPGKFSCEITTTNRSEKKAARLCGVLTKTSVKTFTIFFSFSDAPLSVVMGADDRSTKPLTFPDSHYSSSRIVPWMFVATQLFYETFNVQNTSSTIDQCIALVTKLKLMGTDAAISKSHRALVLSSYINPKCCLEWAAATFPTKDLPPLASDDFAKTFFHAYSAKYSSYCFSTDLNGNGEYKKSKETQTILSIIHHQPRRWWCETWLSLNRNSYSSLCSPEKNPHFEIVA